MKTALDATYSVLNTMDALVIQWRMDIIAHNAFSNVKVFRSVEIFITAGLVQVEIMAITLYHQPLEEQGRQASYS